MHEPIVPTAPVLTVTERADGWTVLCNGEPVVTGLYTRTAAETVVETWPQYEPGLTLVPLTATERRVAARAVRLMGEMAVALNVCADAHLDLARKLWPELDLDDVDV